MKNLTWQNPEQLFVAQVLINKVKSKCCGIKAHEWQLKYYLYVFEQNGITGVKGILEYPTLRKTQEVFLSDIDRQAIAEMKLDISKIVMDEKCPPLQRKSICKSCSYYEFCYSAEEEV